MDTICHSMFEVAEAEDQFYTVDSELQTGLERNFKTGVNHEVRTALNAIMGFAQLIHSQEITPEEKISFSAIICQQSEYILHIFNKVLENYHDHSARY
jgi:signal transduction histidine kinase